MDEHGKISAEEAQALGLSADNATAKDANEHLELIGEVESLKQQEADAFEAVKLKAMADLVKELKDELELFEGDWAEFRADTMCWSRVSEELSDCLSEGYGYDAPIAVTSQGLWFVAIQAVDGGISVGHLSSLPPEIDPETGNFKRHGMPEEKYERLMSELADTANEDDEEEKALNAAIRKLEQHGMSVVDSHYVHNDERQMPSRDSKVKQVMLSKQLEITSLLQDKLLSGMKATTEKERCTPNEARHLAYAIKSALEGYTDLVSEIVCDEDAEWFEGKQ